MARQPETAEDLLAAFADAAAGKRVVIERDGQRVALLPAYDLESLEEYEAEEDAWLCEMADKAKAEWLAEGGESVDAEEVFRRAGLR